MMKKVLFIYTATSPFIQEDIDILRSQYDVATFNADNTTRIKQILSLARLLSHLILHIRRYDFAYIWFADYHSFLPVFFFKNFKKRLFLVIGGYDVCRMKDYKYGSFTNPIRGYMTRYSMKNATKNLCVSHSVERVVKAISPLASTTMLYNGVDLSCHSQSNTEQSTLNADKEDIILCVSIVQNSQKYFIKGIDRLINVCRLAKELKFVLIGADRDLIEELTDEIPKNIEIIPPLEHDKLVSHYMRAKIYCQLSRSESFSVSLAEAMYYNCIPVISNTGGMPEVTGGIGYVVNGDNIKETVEDLRKAITDSNTSSIRERIEHLFTKDVRKKALLKILSDSFLSVPL